MDQRGSDFNRTGSVKRAREMMEAGIPRNEVFRGNPRLPPPSVSNPPPGPRSQADGRQGSSRPPRRNPNIPPPLPLSVSTPQKIRGQTISRPIPAPQWPLMDEATGPDQRANMPPEQKRVPPQRPPRPTNVPSFLDQSQLRENAQPSYSPQQVRDLGSQDRSPEYWEDNYGQTPKSQGSNSSGTRTSTTSSRPSTGSSVGEIPDFPVPAIPTPQTAQVRRGQNTGPPPTFRRGASSYYSQGSFVSPIPEEIPDKSPRHPTSYASSNVMPSPNPNWRGESREYHGNDSNIHDLREEEEEGRASSPGDHDENTALVRQASLGKRHKPSLTTIRSSEEIGPRLVNVKSQDRLKSRLPVARAAAATALATAAVDEGQKARSAERSRSPSNASSFSPVDNEKQPFPLPDQSQTFNTPRSQSPELPSGDPRVGEILGGLEKGGALPNQTRQPQAMSDRIPDTRRPPRLDIDAVKDAESRGSLTSLPELIRRATKLATNLDKGRTASRLGMLDMLNAGGSPKDNTSRTYTPYL